MPRRDTQAPARFASWRESLRVVARRGSAFAVVVLLAAGLLASCGTADAGDDESAVEVPPTPTQVVVIPTSTPRAVTPTPLPEVTPVPTGPVPTPEPERLDTLVDPTNPPLCLALIPTHPAEGSTGSVAYAFPPEYVQFEYQSLYIVNYVGGSALTAGLPGVRTGDQFTFAIDDAMQIETGDPIIVTSLPDGSEEPCAIRWVPGETVEAIDGASVGY